MQQILTVEQILAMLKGYEESLRMLRATKRVHEIRGIRAIHSLLMTSASVMRFRHSSRFTKPS